LGDRAKRRTEAANELREVAGRGVLGKTEVTEMPCM
jgi:hypothetical protein